MSKRATAAAWLHRRAAQAPLAAVLAAGAALTAVGMYSVAVACGWPPYLAWLHSLAADGLGAVAIRAAINLKGGSRFYAVLVCIASTGMSAAVQAMHLRSGAGLTGPPSPNLRTAIGFWPAPAALLGAHLHHLTTKPAASVPPVAGAAAGPEGSFAITTPPVHPETGSALTPLGAESQTWGGPAVGSALPTPDAVRELSGPPTAPPARPEVHVDPGHVDLDQSAPDPVDLTDGPGSVDPGSVDHQWSRGPGVQGSRGSTGSQGQGSTVDLDRLTEDQLVVHYLTQSTPALTLDQLAHRLGVSRSTTKRRVNAARASNAPLRIVR